MGIRFFYLDEQDGLHHVGHKRYGAIFCDGDEVVPELGSRMVSLLQVVYDTANGKPSAIRGITGWRYPFSRGGWIRRG